MSIHEIINFRQATETIFTSGQPTAEQMQLLAAEGFDTIINLALDHSQPHLEGEADLVRALGMAYIHIPVEWTAPKEADFKRFEEEMAKLSPGKILIHCAANYRATAFFGLYAQKHLGWSAEQANALRATVWNPAEYPAWQALIQAIQEK